jgi:hypothetical protein
MSILRTKTFWAGIAGLAGGVGLICGGDVGTGVATILISLQQIFQRAGTLKIVAEVATKMREL